MILVAPTSFKETYSALAVAEAMGLGVDLNTYDDVHFLPLSDGGPGLIDALLPIPSHTPFSVTVSGPLGAPTEARFLLELNHNHAIVESADACGLHLVPSNQRDPLRTTTYGVGELILHAAKRAQHVFVGVGGSATIDCGLGLAEAFGWRLLDERGNALDRGGQSVLKLAHIERGTTNLPRVTVLTDVHNPLFGRAGAARVFGAQKGASPAVVDLLDAGLERVAAIIERDIGVDVANMRGAGAAGGLAAGLHAFAGAELVSGSSWVLEQVGFNRLLQEARAVITGEGSYDAQSAMGKITGEVIARAGAHDVPVLLIAGSVSGQVPAHVHAVTGNKLLELADIEQLVRDHLPRLLSQ